MASDPSYSNVSLLLHFDGANGSTTFTDNSPTPKTPTVGGNAQISTTSPLFGTGCGLFDGTGDYIQYAQNSAFDFGSGDFTIELAWKPTVTTTDQMLIAYGNDTSSGFNADVAFRVQYRGAGAGGRLRFSSFFGESSFTMDTVNPLSTTDYSRISVSRSGANFYLIINGSALVTASGSHTQNSPSSRVLNIGQSLNTSRQYANGRMDELRITKGVGRYTGTYTVDSTAFPNQ